ncbi:MAG TPA: TIM barrel protein [Planctomycetota bacterium]|nr:TIM barrel protein [Planctomycetota bacterium]
MVGFSTNIRIGLWLDSLKLGVKSGLKAAAAMQPDSLGLDAFEAEIAPRNLGLSGRRDLARHVRGVGALAALKADVGGRRLADAQALDANLARIREALQLAADLGAPRLQLPAGFVPVDAKENETVRRTLAEAARAVISMASATGVRVCWLAGSEAPETLAEFLNGVDSGGMIDVDLNPGAFVMRDVDPLKALNALSARVSMARAADHYRGGAEAPFGSGDVRWGEVLVGLATLNRNAPVDVLAARTLDGERVAGIAGAVRKLKAVLTKPV